jgi:hypothetical protein
MKGWRYLMLGTLLCVPPVQSGRLAGEVPAANSRIVFCAYGSPSLVSSQMHPTVVVVIVELHGRSRSEKMGISDVALIARNGGTTIMKRLDSVAVFDKRRLPNETLAAYYLNGTSSDKAQQWNGILPTGMLRLRVEAEVSNLAARPELCRVRIGQQVIEGPLSFGPWVN